MAITPGGRVGDASPLGTGKRKLSDYEREVAHALMRRGVKPKSRAIAMARGIIDRAATTGRWGRGKKASPNVVAGAQASVAQRKSFSAGHKLSNAVELAQRYTHGWKLLDADHAGIASTMTTTRQAQAALTHHDAMMSQTRGATREKHRAAARVYKARREEIVTARKRRGEQGTLFANEGATIPTMTNPARDLVLAEAAERGMIDLGRDGAKWRHGWIPLNGIAAAIKAKKYHGGGKASLPSGKSRINVGANAEHAMAPKGKARATAAQRARSEAARRAEVMRRGKESDAEAVAQGSRAHTPARGAAAAKALQAEHDRRTVADKQQSEKFPEIRAKSTEDLSAMIQGKTAHDDEQVGVARAELARRNRAAETANADKLKSRTNDAPLGGHVGTPAEARRQDLLDQAKAERARREAGSGKTNDAIRTMTEDQLSQIVRGRTDHSFRQMATARAELQRRNRTAETANADKLKGGSGETSANFGGQTFSVGDKVKFKERVSGKGLRVQRGQITQHHGHGSFSIRKEDGTEVRRIIDDLGHDKSAAAKAELASKPRSQALHNAQQVAQDRHRANEAKRVQAEDAKAKADYEKSAPHRAALAKATAEHEKRSGKVSLTGNERYNLTTGERLPDAAPASSGGDFIKGDTVENSAGQRMRVISASGDNVSVRFPSGMTAQVSAKSVKRVNKGSEIVPLRPGQSRFSLPGKDAPLPVGRRVSAHELSTGKGEIRDAESGHIISTGHVSVRRARTVANAHNAKVEAKPNVTREQGSRMDSMNSPEHAARNQQAWAGESVSDLQRMIRQGGQAADGARAELARRQAAGNVKSLDVRRVATLKTQSNHVLEAMLERASSSPAKKAAIRAILEERRRRGQA